MNPENNHIKELDSLRGLAALLVVLFHTPWIQRFDIPIIKNGDLMVDLFFILSGFVIYKSYANKVNNTKELIQFQFLRLGRVYPIHIFFLLAFMSNEIARSLAGLSGLINIGKPAFYNLDSQSILQQITLSHAIGPTGNKLEFNAPSWSISVEFYTYLIFAIVILIFKRFSAVFFLTISAISIYLLSSAKPDGYNELLRCFTGFFTGCLLALMAEKCQTRFQKSSLPIALLLFVSIISLDKESISSLIILAPASLLVFFTATAEKSHINKILLSPKLAWLGKISYSVYMCHWYVLWMLGMGLKRILERPETVGTSGYATLVLDPSESVLTSILAVFLTLTIAHLTHKYLEEPARLWSKAVINKF